MKDSDAGECRSLREIELEVEAEMRAWGRKRLQEKLQQQADQHGRVFPRSHRPMWHARQQRLTLRTAVGPGMRAMRSSSCSASLGSFH